MIKFVLRRMAGILLVMLGVTSLVFLLIHLVPGDPVEVMLGESAAGADRMALRESLGLNRPLLQQWGAYLANILSGDLGASMYDQRPVTGIIAERIGATLQLGLAACAWSLLLALPLGLIAAQHKGRLVDHLSRLFAGLAVAIPNFLMGPLLILLFAVWLGWFPVSGRDAGLSLVLPSLTLGSAMAAVLARMLRSSILEVLREDYVRTAQAKGLAHSYILFRHILPNALLPVVTLLGMQLGALLTGAVITEVVFAWPGIGQLLVESIQKRDYPVVQGCILLISLIYVLLNRITDIFYGVVDPRIREA